MRMFITIHQPKCHQLFMNGEICGEFETEIDLVRYLKTQNINIDNYEVIKNYGDINYLVNHWKYIGYYYYR